MKTNTHISFYRITSERETTRVKVAKDTHVQNSDGTAMWILDEDWRPGVMFRKVRKTAIPIGGRWGIIDGTITEQEDLKQEFSYKVNNDDLADVALSGDYNDLENTPADVTGIKLDEDYLAGLKYLIDSEETLSVPEYYQYNVYDIFENDGVIDNDGVVNIL